MVGYVAMLRAVNVGGAKVSMAELRKVAEDAGFSAVSTHLNSGNLLFSAPAGTNAAGTAAEHCETIRQAVTSLVGRPVEVVIRTSAQLQKALDGARRHFSEAAESRVAIAFLDRSAGDGPADRLGEWEVESYLIDGSEVYLHYPNGQARSKLTIDVIEKKLEVVATVRGINTVAGLISKASG